MSGKTVSKNERGLVRVFALSMDDAQAKALRDNDAPDDDDLPAPQSAALGVTYLDSDFTEVIRISDLEDLGLTGYLIEGNGIDPENLGRDRAKLDALEGWVFLVYSSAFGGFAAVLDPAPDLTLIGTYAEPGVDWSDTRTLTSEAARGSTAPAKKPPSDAAMSGRIAMAALLILFAVTALMVWVAS